MTLNYPELFIPSLISFLLVLYVVPWHLRIRNIATLSMSFWMLMLNAVHIINRKSLPDNDHPQSLAYRLDVR
jgi:pheromone a factor receptor